MDFSGLIHRVERLLRAPLLGAVLLAATGVFIALRWRGTDWSVLSSADPSALIAAGAAYAFALLALAQAAGSRPRGDATFAILESQLHKYTPGVVWQAQPLVAAGGIELATRFAWTLVLAAALAVTAGTAGTLAILGGVTAIALFAVSVWRRGWKESAARSSWTVLAVVGMVASGAAVGAGLGFDWITTGRAVASAWGLGVAAVPVPSGLGVREASLTVLLAEQGAPVAAAHRVLTLFVDVSLGLTALFRRRSRRAH